MLNTNFFLGFGAKTCLGGPVKFSISGQGFGAGAVYFGPAPAPP